jgi:hypothetical protein
MYVAKAGSEMPLPFLYTFLTVIVNIQDYLSVNSSELITPPVKFNSTHVFFNLISSFSERLVRRKC